MAKTSYQRQKERIAELNKEKSKIYTDLCKIAGIIDCSWTEMQEIILHYRMDNDIYNAIWAGGFHDKKLLGFTGGVFSMMQKPKFICLLGPQKVREAIEGPSYISKQYVKIIFKGELSVMMQCLKPKHKIRING
jgi:hypothetical protein